MNLLDLIARQPVPEAWAEGEKIPWNDPAFSERMLREHLSQAHDLASRRTERIDCHVDWLHAMLLEGQRSFVLDLGCGPGLYATRLARRGHTVIGIDFSPASIAYARQQAAGLPCQFLEADIRLADYGRGRFDLAMLIFGEFNVFRREDARAILRKIHTALAVDGVVALEVHTVDTIRRAGQQPPSWYGSTTGLFSTRPHLVLTENFWLDEQQIAIQRYFIVDADTGVVTRHAASMQAYSDEELRLLLQESGFADVTFYPSLYGEVDAGQADFFVVVGRKTDME